MAAISNNNTSLALNRLVLFFDELYPQVETPAQFKKLKNIFNKMTQLPESEGYQLVLKAYATKLEEAEAHVAKAISLWERIPPRGAAVSPSANKEGNEVMKTLPKAVLMHILMMTPETRCAPVSNAFREADDSLPPLYRQGLEKDIQTLLEAYAAHFDPTNPAEQKELKNRLDQILEMHVTNSAETLHIAYRMVAETFVRFIMEKAPSYPSKMCRDLMEHILFNTQFKLLHPALRRAFVRGSQESSDAHKSGYQLHFVKHLADAHNVRMALILIAGISDPACRSSAFDYIVGRDRILTETEAAYALTIAEMMTCAISKATALLTMGRYYAQQQNYSKAIELAMQNPNPMLRQAVLNAILISLEKEERVNEAFSLLQQIRDPVWQALFAQSAFMQYMRKSLFEEALNMIEKTDRQEPLYELLVNQAFAQAKVPELLTIAARNPEILAKLFETPRLKNSPAYNIHNFLHN